MSCTRNIVSQILSCIFKSEYSTDFEYYNERCKYFHFKREFTLSSRKFYVLLIYDSIFVYDSDFIPKLLITEE